MKLKPIDKTAGYFAGTSPLPAGAIPMAAHDIGVGIVCLMPTGSWITWQAGVIKNAHPETQKEVIAMTTSFFGGADKTADRFGISRRTIEGWAQGRPIKLTTAYCMASAMDTDVTNNKLK